MSYEYSYSNTMEYPITFYQVKKGSDGVVRIAWMKDHGPEVQVINGTDEVLEHIGAITAEYKLHRLRCSYYPSVQVLDGTSWHAYIRFEKGSVSTGGNNAKAPEKLMGGLYAINSYLQSLIDSAKESDIILREDYRAFTTRR